MINLWMIDLLSFCLAMFGTHSKLFNLNIKMKWWRSVENVWLRALCIERQHQHLAAVEQLRWLPTKWCCFGGDGAISSGWRFLHSLRTLQLKTSGVCLLLWPVVLFLLQQEGQWIHVDTENLLIVENLGLGSSGSVPWVVGSWVMVGPVVRPLLLTPLLWFGAAIIDNQILLLIVEEQGQVELLWKLLLMHQICIITDLIFTVLKKKTTHSGHGKILLNSWWWNREAWGWGGWQEERQRLALLDLTLAEQQLLAHGEFRLEAHLCRVDLIGKEEVRLVWVATTSDLALGNRARFRNYLLRLLADHCLVGSGCSRPLATEKGLPELLWRDCVLQLAAGWRRRLGNYHAVQFRILVHHWNRKI